MLLTDITKIIRVLLGAFEKTAVAICQRLEDQQNRCNECR